MLKNRIMLKRILSTIVVFAACIAVNAQGTCLINGTIDKDCLCDGKKIKTVTLTRTDELGREIEVATAKVKKNRYSFKYELAKDEPVLMYTIKGLGGEKDVEVFVEPGEVAVSTFSNAASIVTGTPTNDLYLEYIANRNDDSLLDFCKEKLVRQHGSEWLESAEGKEAINKIAREKIKTKAYLMRLLIDNNASPMTPLMIGRWLPILTPAYAEQMLNTVSTTLHSHPYYHSLRNRVLANNMKVGNEVPDISLHLANGDKKQLSDYRGKYVVLNFWASDCGKSADMFAELHALCDVIKENNGQFVIISVALDSDCAQWCKAITANKADREVWLHACDGCGMASPAAKLFGVEKTPRIVVVEPEGRAVSLDMDIDELVMRAEQILSGDLYYLDDVK